MSYPPPPAPSAPAPSGKPQLRGRTPRRLGWIFLIVGLVLTIVGFVLVGTLGLSKVDKFQRVSISSGSGTVNVDRTGKWVIYYEASNVSSSINQIPNVSVSVADPSGQPVDVKPYGNRSDGKVSKFTYDYSGHHGVAAAQFTATVKGKYAVEAAPPQGETLPADADLAFGEDVINASTVAGALLAVAGVLLLIAGIVLLIVGYVKRSRHKRELATTGGYGGYGPPGGYGGGYGAPGAYPPPGGGYPQQAGGYPQQPGGYPPPGGGYPQQGYGQQGYPPPPGTTT